MYKFLAIISLLLLNSASIMAYEEPRYTLVEKNDNIEIRDYEKTYVAEVTVEGSRKVAQNKAFRILFKYISGHNTTQTSIDMTAPVAQTENSVEIPMTVPVSQTQDDAGRWSVVFYMPNDMTEKNIPTPKDNRVKIREVEAQTLAAIRFSGRQTEKKIEKNKNKLREYLLANGKTFSEPYIFARYDGPFKPWFLRRNEVLFQVLN
ncbi:SOUL family heme-binding protein [Marinicella sp. W31]|uniref:SOUL family heme-binding protein n=1 Tax=Marinicella sp. W31 TaxID=3023713 RepID=UPI0037568A51